MTTPSLANKTALITGGGTGIGAAVARHFALAGANVLITGRRLPPLQAVAEAYGCVAFCADSSILEQCRQAVARTVELWGGLDILVSNAGVIYEGSAVEQKLDQWQQTLDVNITGVMNMAREAIPVMVRGGAIVNISSVAGLASGRDMASYVTSKTAVLGLTRSLALDCGPLRIRVNALCPGWVKTPMSDEEMAALAASKDITVEQAVADSTRYLPLQRMANPNEIATCVEFLASDMASFVTGVTLVADGGGDCVDVGTLSFA